MGKIVLVRPEKKYAEQIMDYREEMLQNNDSLDGCGGLEDVESYEEWVDFEASIVVTN